LSDKLACDVTTKEDGHRCVLEITESAADEDGALIAEFRNEVLDETLRARIREETQEVRNLILALAFSQTGLVEDAEP
jgi:His-Xaa-Ser system protein HxsD